MACTRPISIQRPGQSDPKNRVSVPCGICSGCLKARRMMWTIRLLEEAKIHKEMCFITLTYDEKYLTYGADGLETLVKRDLQLFIKRLRKNTSKKIRYYAVGEYGPETFRPHYHIIAYGIDINSYKQIVESWNLGFVTVGENHERRMGYITKYHVNRGQYKQGTLPPFSLMSTRPGLGFNYIERMWKHHYKNIDNCYYADFEKKLPLPRYYKKKLYSQSQLDLIAKAVSEDYTKELVEEYKRLNPGKTYFKYRLDQIKNADRGYKEKTNLNSKL